VRTNATIGGIAYQRRWTVYGFSPAAGGAATVKVVGVSVMWQEPGSWTPREIVLYTQLFEASGLVIGLTANQ
jgi:hypothetical protein